jgi:hypothetical protein
LVNSDASYGIAGPGQSRAVERKHLTFRENCLLIRQLCGEHSGPSPIPEIRSGPFFR